MGLFGNKEEKKMLKLEDINRMYGTTGLNEKDLETMKEIEGDALFVHLNAPNIKKEDKTLASYLSILVQQNWLLLRQLDRINEKLDKLIEK